MAKKVSPKSNYPSRYCPSGWVTPNQYIVELLCEQKAKRFGTGELPIRFWNNPEWEKEFKSQLRATSSLLKKYQPKAIIAAIKDRKLFTLRPKWVEPIIAEKEKNIVKIPDTIKLREEIVENPTIRKTEDKILGKFGDLD